MEIKTKKGAMELSIGTVVIIVLAMSMLVLGLVLIGRIFSGATGSVNDLNDKVKGEITNLFADESSNVVVLLGADRTAKVKQGAGTFYVAIGAKKADKSQIEGRDSIQYTVWLDTSTGNCVADNPNVASYFPGGVDKTVRKNFDDFEGSSAFARIAVNVPDGAPLCSQKVYIDIYDKGETTAHGGASFIVQIVDKGFSFS